MAFPPLPSQSIDPTGALVPATAGGLGLTWRDRLQSASFRGVPFFVETHQASGGRNGVVFKYVGGGVYVEDLGAGEKRYRIDAYVIGPDYFPGRDALLSAAQDVAGPGTLVHPYLGTKTVSVQRWELEESRREGGTARIGLEFIESVVAPVQPAADASGAALDDSADDALTSLNTGYAGNFQTSLPTSSPLLPGGAPGLSLPGFSLQSVAQVLVDWTGAVRAAMAPIIHTTAALATMKSQLDAIVLDSLVLVKTPTALLTRLGLVATSMLDWPDTPRLGVSALLQAFGFTTSAVRPLSTTVTRQIEQSNQDQITLLLKGITIVQASRFAIQANTLAGRTVSTALRASQVDPAPGYDSYQDAVSVRDALTGAIDDLSLTASDDVFNALQQVRADLAAAVPGTPNRLPQIVSLTPPVTVPVLVLSQRLYGNLALADDIITRNNIAHPGFVPGSVPLQVLSNV